MNEKIKIFKVWDIENNELCCKNKKVSIMDYDGMNIYTLKEERNYDIQNFLIKDKNNEFWNLGIAPIRLNLFIGDVNSYLSSPDKIIAYRKDIKDIYSKLDLKTFWTKKINENRYFNKCELEYIRRYIPEIYAQAKESRKLHQEKVQKEKELTKLKQKQFEINTVNKTNSEFQKEITKIKHQIFVGEMVEVKDLEFYKDNKYENGKTIQNNILYLAKEYGIQIPLATQGFINSKLVGYNFREKKAYFKLSNNNQKCSSKMAIYLEQIFQKIKEEYKVKLKNKSKER